MNLNHPDGTPQGSVERVLAHIGVRTHQRIRAKDRRNERNAGRELELQYQYEISGTATVAPVWMELPAINFDYSLHYAPGQRESTLEEPHFTYGSKTNPPVGIHATVKEWLQDENTGAVVGAIVAVAALAGGSTPFKGKVHLTFQGFGTLNEEDEEELMNEGIGPFEG